MGELQMNSKLTIRGLNAMNLPRRRFLHLAAGAAALPTASRFAWAQAYPTRPVRLLVGFPPGGAADTTRPAASLRLAYRAGPASDILRCAPGP